MKKFLSVLILSFSLLTSCNGVQDAKSKNQMPEISSGESFEGLIEHLIDGVELNRDAQYSLRFDLEQFLEEGDEVLQVYDGEKGNTSRNIFEITYRLDTSDIARYVSSSKFEDSVGVRVNRAGTLEYLKIDLRGDVIADLSDVATTTTSTTTTTLEGSPTTTLPELVPQEEHLEICERYAESVGSKLEKSFKWVRRFHRDRPACSLSACYGKGNKRNIKDHEGADYDSTRISFEGESIEKLCRTFKKDKESGTSIVNVSTNSSTDDQIEIKIDGSKMHATPVSSVSGARVEIKMMNTNSLVDGEVIDYSETLKSNGRLDILTLNYRAFNFSGLENGVTYHDTISAKFFIHDNLIEEVIVNVYITKAGADEIKGEDITPYRDGGVFKVTKRSFDRVYGVKVPVEKLASSLRSWYRVVENSLDCVAIDHSGREYVLGMRIEDGGRAFSIAHVENNGAGFDKGTFNLSVSFECHAEFETISGEKLKTNRFHPLKVKFD